MPNLHLIPKILNFTLYLSQCSAPPYLGLVYKTYLGFTSADVGVLACIPPFVAIIAGPLLSFIADISGRPKLVQAMCMVALSAVLWILVSVPLTFGSTCGVIVLYAFVSAPVGSLMDVLTLNMLGDERDLYGQQRLFGSLSCGICTFALGMLIQAMGGNLKVAFVAHSIFTAMFIILMLIVSRPRRADKPKDASKNDPAAKSGIQKQASKILKSVEEDYDPDRTAEALPMTAVSATGGAVEKPKRRVSIAASAINNPPSLRRKSTLIIPPPPPEGPTFKWLLAPDVIAFYMAVTLMGGVISGVSNFLWIFMTDSLNAPTTLLGLTGPAQVVLQFPFFFFSKQILEKIGVRYTIIMAHVALISRVLIYTGLKPGPMMWAILVPELLHGAVFSGLWAAAVAYSVEIAPRGMEFLAQGILGAFYGGLGAGVGSIVSGIIYNKFGALWLFRGHAGVILLSLIIYSAVPSRRPVKTQRVPEAEKRLDKQVRAKVFCASMGVMYCLVRFSDFISLLFLSITQASEKLLDVEVAQAGIQGFLADEEVEEARPPVSMSRRASVAAAHALEAMARNHSMGGMGI
ncbi:hypothetical protein HDV00_010303 [Rhizophlyctis rosea]|nr:hypothetical protein HDV00_010303 [Rhizophlyctis rosea]